MSGYNKDTGIYEMTNTKAKYWLRRKDIPDSIVELDGNFFANLFEHYGFEITKTGSGYFHVVATPGQVWETLSGMPSDPEMEKLDW